MPRGVGRYLAGGAGKPRAVRVLGGDSGGLLPDSLPGRQPGGGAGYAGKGQGQVGALGQGRGGQSAFGAQPVLERIQKAGLCTVGGEPLAGVPKSLYVSVQRSGGLGVLTVRAFQVWGKALGMIKGDRVAILLSLSPVIIGLIGLAFFSEWFFTDLREHILRRLGGGPEVSHFLQGAMVALLAVFYYFLVSWLFVLAVSVVASPFNDLLSTRVGRRLGEREEPSRSGNFLLWVGKVWFNELKKILCLGGLSVVALLLGFFPPLIPVSIALSSLLLASSFLDYSWSRRGLSLGECLKNIRGHCWSYGLSGFLFLFAFTIPLLNIFMVPYAVVYYTVLYVEGEK